MKSVRFEWPKLYPKQHAAFFGDGAKHRAIEGSTKSGKTGGAMIWQFFQGFKYGGAHAWFSPVKSQARDSFYRAVDALPASKVDDHETYRRITVEDRPVVFYYLSSDTPDHIYGKGFRSVVVDEASRVKQESWSSIRTLGLSTGAPYRAVGNVRDRINWHYKKCREAESSSSSSWDYHQLHWSDAVAAPYVPVTREGVEQLREDLPKHAARSLLENEAMADASNPFGGFDRLESIAVDALDPGDPVAYGFDLARVQDKTAGVGFAENGRPAYQEQFKGAPWGEIIRRVAERIDGPACVDETGVGDAVVPEIARRASGGAGPANVEGVKFTGPMKRELYESLAVALDDGEIRPLAGEAVSQLGAVQTHATRSGYTYSTGADHDDLVDAYALALRAYRGRRLTREAQDNTGGATIDAAGWENKGW